MTTTIDKPRATAYGYARVSTKRQELKGYSLEAQEEQIKGYCEQNNIELLGFYSEAESGKSSSRPQLTEVLNLSNLSTSILIVAKIDRLTRDLNFLTKLQAHGTPFIALDMPEANPTMLQVMVSFAEYENRIRSARTREGMQKAKAKGKVFGTQGHKNLNSYYEKVAESIDPDNTRGQIDKDIAKLNKQEASSQKEKQLEALNLKRNAIERKIGRKLIKPASDKVSEIAMQRALAIKPYVDECVKEGADSLRKVAKCLTDKRIKTPSGKDTWNIGNIQTLYKQLDKIND